jgi:hypothetical protein
LAYFKISFACLIINHTYIREPADAKGTPAEKSDDKDAARMPKREKRVGKKD